jgi:hypothetical protein
LRFNNLTGLCLLLVLNVPSTLFVCTFLSLCLKIHFRIFFLFLYLRQSLALLPGLVLA